MNKKINVSKYIWNSIFVVIVLVLLFVPPAKAYVIQGLMQMGLFKPQVTELNAQKPADLSGIKFKDAEGNITDLGDLKGKVIFLNFWATWCPPCQAEMPSVEKLYQQFSKDKNVVFLFVDADGNFEKSKKFMDRKKYNLPVYAIGGYIPEGIFKGALPTTVVFDKMARISYRGEGAANYSDKKFLDFMQKLSDM
ncbi:TlpA family protein disulfide reductase [Pedobacter nutrimenti]|uniref:Thiol-disulfide isomerase/thioredoxin n=1 Tax=Pedobacter nutrimenti TaxID=1241337 RepID=A0A318UIN9_9SPHI|nr:TlpA disulfide reductase family protein [Pedobacter nutrimenti]PYF75841.1 thiol-disulfide isomerase/thioredoxin [Pedobacter nutrimenti]|eukprot:gene11256-13137_t